MKKLPDYLSAGFIFAILLICIIGILYDLLREKTAKKKLKILFISFFIIAFYVGLIWFIRSTPSIRESWHHVSSLFYLIFIICFIGSITLGSALSGADSKTTKGTVSHILLEIAFNIRYVLLALLPFIIALEIK